MELVPPEVEDVVPELGELVVLVPVLGELVVVVEVVVELVVVVEPVLEVVVVDPLVVGETGSYGLGAAVVLVVVVAGWVPVVVVVVVLVVWSSWCRSACKHRARCLSFDWLSSGYWSHPKPRELP